MWVMHVGHDLIATKIEFWIKFTKITFWREKFQCFHFSFSHFCADEVQNLATDWTIGQ